MPDGVAQHSCACGADDRADRVALTPGWRWRAVITMLLLIIGIGWKIVANFTRLTDSVERLNHNIEIVTSQVGAHEHRISMLEGSEQSRSVREDGGRVVPPAAVIYPLPK